MSNVDEGYACLLPKVEKVEVAPLWLTGEGPYNVRLTWNGFEPSKVRVNNVKFKVTKATAASDSFDYSINARTDMGVQVPRDFDLSASGHNIAKGHHGEYSITVTWDAYSIKSGRVIADTDAGYNGKPMKYDGVTAKAYYHKYDRDFGDIPNWYRYWVQDGTLTDTSDFALDNHDVADDKFHFKANFGSNLGGCTPGVADTVERLPGTDYPVIRGYNGRKSNKYQISDLVAATKTPRQAGNYGSVGVAYATGVHSLAANVPHEKKHGSLNNHLQTGASYLITCPQKMPLSSRYAVAGASPEAALRNILNILRNNGKESTSYYALLKDCVEGRESYMLDLDGDGLDDREEHDGRTRGVQNTFSWLSPNTFRWNNTTYIYYADQEILAREAEDTPLGVDESKDWAFPGSQIPSNPTPRGMQKVAWTDGLRNAFKNTLQHVSPDDSTFTTRSVRLAAASDAAEVTASELNTFPLFDTNEVGSAVSVISSSIITGVKTDDKYQDLLVLLKVWNNETNATEFVLNGYLADAAGAPVAYVSCSMSLGNGENTVRFSVPGKIIYAQKSRGYSLKYFTAMRADDEFGQICGWGENLASCDPELNYTEFGAPEVLFGAVTFAGRSVKGDLVANCEIELNGESTYDLVATLMDTNGNFVASTTASGITGVSERSVPLTFDRNAIYLSGHDGPYTIGYLELRSGGETVDTACDKGLSEPYACRDFAPDELSLAVDEPSFSTTYTMGDDGLVTAFTCAFNVTNLLSNTSVYQVDMYLSGTNGNFVTAASVRADLTAGSNRVEVVFDGSRVNEKGVNGPYVVREVVLQPAGTTGTVFRFVPKMSPIDLTAADFGSYPFKVTGDPVLNTDTGNDDGVFAVTVPLEVLRANTVTVSAMLMDGDGQYVATATKSVTYDVAKTDAVTISFAAQDIRDSGRRGPYTIGYLKIESDLDGVEPYSVAFKEEGLVRDYVLYVDDDATDDSGDGLSWVTAKRTIQAAVDEAQDGDVIQVAAGTYEPFVCDNKSIQIIGIYGHENTFVDGGNSNRCATLGREESQTNTVLQGFSLVNGDATTDNVLLLWNCGGGVCCGSVYDCAITDCAASKGGGAYYGRLESCLITGNEATTYGGGSYYGERINCTICDNNAKSDAGGTYYGSTRNSIVWHNTRGSSGSYDDNWYSGSFAYSVTSPLPEGSGNMSEDPGFVDEEDGDYALSRDSVCIDAGNDEEIAGDEDIVGYVRIMGDSVDIGAFERWQRKRTYGVAEFAAYGHTMNEGGNFEVEVWGGKTNCDTSVEVYMSYAAASAKDIDLSRAAVDGVTPKGGLKFPLRLTWNAGDTAAKIITIPVKVDKDVEGYESFWLQLASPSGIEFGEASSCTLTIEDDSIPSSIGLSQAVNNPTLKASSSGSGKWTVGDDAEYWAADRGVYNAVSPSLAKGKSSTLSLSGVSGKGDFVVMFYFDGDEDDDSTLAIYAGKNHMKTYEHSSVGSRWQRFTINDENTGSHTYSYVFTQGSDPDSKVKMAYAYWVPDGKSSPVMVYVTTAVNGCGYVSGMGYYTIGSTAKPTATAYPGYEFDAWYSWSDSESKYVEYSKNAKLSLKVTGTTDLMAVFKAIPYAGAIAVPANAGKVSGLGYCAEGKKVSLKATANKGFVFAGWELNGNPVSKLPTLLIDRSKAPAKDSSKQSVITNFNYTTTYKAKFITEQEDKANIAVEVNGMGLAPWVSKVDTCALATNIWTGVYLEWPVAASALSDTTVKVAGLPSGLKFAAKDVTQKTGSGKTAQTVVIVPANTIYGAPSAASKVDKNGKSTPSAIKLTVTTAGKSSQTYQIDTTVNPLPSWAVGTFTGPSYVKDVTNGLATVTIASSGKISVKQPVGGKSTSFAANYFSSQSVEAETELPVFYASLTTKAGKETLTNQMVVCGRAGNVCLSSGSEQIVTNGYIWAELFEAGQYNWKIEPWKTLVKPLDRQTIVYYIDSNGVAVDDYDKANSPAIGVDGVSGKVTLKFSASGVVSVTGEFAVYDAIGMPVYKSGKLVTVKATGSTAIVPCDGGCSVMVYLAPKGLKTHSRCLVVPIN